MRQNHGAIIGRRGETLDALQYLTSLVANRGTEEYIRVSLNVGDYREKRDETLRGLARKSASQVLKYGRNVVLEPMNPYERRVIHTEIQEIEGVKSHSIGSDSDRRVVISLEEGVKPTHGGNQNRGRGGIIITVAAVGVIQKAQNGILTIIHLERRTSHPLPVLRIGM